MSRPDTRPADAARTPTASPWLPAQRQVVAVLAGALLALLVAAWAVYLSREARVPDRLPQPIQLQQAEVLHLAGPEDARRPADAQARWQVVPLPDTWAQRGMSGPGWARYRARFALAAADSPTLQVLAIERLSTHHAVYLNDQLVHDTLDDPVLRRPVPTRIALPPAVLRAGDNRLEIVVDAGVRAGLSTLHLGTDAALADSLGWRHEGGLALPQALNLASLGIGLFMLLLWLLRPGEWAVGCFGALGVITALRNTSYFMSGWVVSAAFTDWLYFVAQTATAVLLGLFALVYTGRRWPVYQRLLLAVGLGWPVLAAVGTLLQRDALARTLLYPWLMLLVLPALGLMLQHARRSRGRTDWALAAALVVVLATAGHDYAYQQGRLPITDSYWMPYAMPLVMALFSALLLQRLVRALEGVARLNTTLERRVAERTRALQSAHSATTRFLAAASHDLRQPMVSIGLLVGLLQDQVSSPGLKRLVQRLQESVRAMEGLLKRLLDLSRLEAGTVRLNLQPVALQPLFDAIQSHHAEQTAAKGVRLRLRPSPRVVHTDPALLEQILRNLVGNAVRYTQSGGVLVAVRPDGPGHCRLSVWDTGPGIPAERHQAIFDEFVRLDDGARDAAAAHDALSGLGLGLAIVKRSADLLACPIQLRSRLGHGSCFSLRLPLATADDTARPPAARTPRPAEPAPRAMAEAAAGTSAAPADSGLAGQPVWLLEDNDAARAAMQLQLQRWGAQVRLLRTLAEARQQLAHADRPPHLLISDQRLPDGLGTDLLTPLRQRWPHCPVLLVTGDTAPKDLTVLAHWAGHGAVVLHKPFDGDTLLAAVRQALATAPAVAL